MGDFEKPKRVSVFLRSLRDRLLAPVASATVLDLGAPIAKGNAGPSNGSDPYRGVVAVLCLGTVLAAIALRLGNSYLVNPVLVDASVLLGAAGGVLFGVACAQFIRSQPLISSASVAGTPTDSASTEGKGAGPEGNEIIPGLGVAFEWAMGRLRFIGLVDVVRIVVASVAFGFILVQLFTPSWVGELTLTEAAVGVSLCLLAAGLAAVSARYFGAVVPARFPESPGLARGARIIAWVFVFTALAVGFAGAKQPAAVRLIHFVLLSVGLFLTINLMVTRRHPGQERNLFPLNLAMLSLFGERANFVGSILDGAEAQLGIDLRSTWALTVVRQVAEPLAVSLVFLGWLASSFTVVGPQEQGLVERLGVSVSGDPLGPGLHLHWPWPIDEVVRLPVRVVQSQQIGHEGEEGNGPEDVLWAVEHAPNEYTLVLGNGRDLITVDAAVQYRITDLKAWRYGSQNPQDAMRSIAYRAVMRTTVSKTLSGVLSENLRKLTEQMRDMVQEDADKLGLGVTVLGMTVGGMHPPVPVAADYEAVVSAELGKVTAVVNAQAFRNQLVPSAQAESLVKKNKAIAEGAELLAEAAGGAWAFRTLESQYRSSPAEYFFRRRLETLEGVLAGRQFTVVDSRYQRDGGQLWLQH